MKIYTHLSEYKSTDKTFVTIGTFDGVHVGHQKVIQNLVESSKKNGATSVLLTFFPHPRMVLNKDLSIKLINTIEERTLLLEKLGLDAMVIHKFSKEFANQSALSFVQEILVKTLNISELIIGYDHHFGKNREGNLEQLKELGHTYAFKVKKISKKDIDNISVSSTKIRTAIENGEIQKANAYLGYHFMLSGKIVKGQNIGEKIGFPTANLFIKESYKLLPKDGSYVVKSIIKGKLVFGMMNIGFRPTVDGTKKTVEIHFFDFNQSIYGEKLQIDVLKFLRNEQKFKSLDDLKNQLLKDKESSQQFINGTFFE